MNNIIELNRTFLENILFRSSKLELNESEFVAIAICTRYKINKLIQFK